MAAHAVVTSTCPTGTGTKDFTKSGFGTPTLVVVTCSKITSGSGTTADMGGSYGAADGTNQFANSWSSEDAVGTSNCRSNRSTSRCLTVLDTDGTTLVEAAFDSFITDGVRLDFTKVSSAYRIIVELFNTANADVGSFVINATSGSDTAVTAPGFQPKLVGFSYAETATSVRLNQGWAAAKSGGDQQHARSFFCLHGQGTTQIATFHRNNRCIAKATQFGWEWTGEFKSFDANGFTVTTRDDDGGNTVDYWCVDGVDVAIEHDDIPSSGDATVTGAGFTPESIVTLSGHGTVSQVNTAITGVFAAAVGYGAGSGTAAADQGVTSWHDRDGRGTSECDTGFYTANCMGNQRYNVAIQYRFDVSSFDASGATLGANATTTSLGSFASLLIKESATGAFTLTADSVSYAWSVQDAALELSAVVDADAVSYTLSIQDAGLVAGYVVAAAAVSYLWTVQDVGLLLSAVLDVESVSYLWTVQDVDLQAGATLDAESVAYTWTIQDAGLVYGAALDADAVAYTWTIADVGLRHDAVLDVEAVSYAWTIQDAGLLHDATLDIEAVAYTWTVQDATLVYSIVLDAEAVAYALSVQDASLVHAAVIDIDPVSYALTIQDASLEYGRVLDAEALSYLWSVQDAGLLFGYQLAADAVSYALSIQDVTLLLGAVLSAETVAYSLAIQNVDLVSGRVVTADALSYTWTVADANLEFGAVVGADAVSYVWDVQDASLLLGAALDAGVVAYLWTISDVTLTVVAITAFDAPFWSTTNRKLRTMATTASLRIATTNRKLRTTEGDGTSG